MKRVFRIQGQGKLKEVGLRGLAGHPELEEVVAKVALIQALIPLGLQAASEALRAEVTRFAGPRHSRRDGTPGYAQWCYQRGSIYLADQKLPIIYQRVRDLRRNSRNKSRPPWGGAITSGTPRRAPNAATATGTTPSRRSPAH